MVRGGEGIPERRIVGNRCYDVDNGKKYGVGNGERKGGIKKGDKDI